MLPPAVLWVDPGKMTGLAALYLSGPGRVLSASEYPFLETCQHVNSMCSVWGSSLAIGWERFDINAQTHKKTREGTTDALHVIGVCRYLAAANGCRVLEPGQQHTPTHAERDQLIRLGWWVPGKDDAQSAACHMLRWLMQNNELTPEQREIVYG
jgi:hypothetical protein